ncbi:IclR family transcriptional regulator [Conexibacter sp. CPCC 206217]|uniref:IclR family transcriptional regulator n=1 Tax=Conexibacter sp. CPCC 206217 TaxID=3064574 RepID=UPI00271B5EDE|nr:IclR family transcriptional regulator [Conexibacter sp. CPCC 206217]MDO8209629.1 IclR family transcriptional regulator [Conexibacter sp. CPCC 206217]
MLPEVDGAQQGLSQSVQRVLRVLEEILLAQDDISLSELVEQLDMPKATVHRMLANLEARGLVSQDPSSLRYGMGLRMSALCARASLRLQSGAALSRRMRELFETAVAEIGETGYVAVLDRSEVIYIDSVESPHALRAAAPIGTRRDIHCTAVGKVLVAGLDRASRWELIGSKPLEQVTEHTITDPEALERNIATVQEQGHAIDVEEFAPGLVCLAAPIHDDLGLVVAAVGITGPIGRMSGGDRTRAVQRLVELAHAMSHNLEQQSTREKGL